ncbi:uncharacterized protein BROUX77_005895 [Berkeleyomyces rouxiae]|uniref:uncharacterized protein n=1 Tax=Berkeleyomyces rouxiae TaxID=2035830 RepID=UPI003B7AA8E6
MNSQCSSRKASRNSALAPADNPVAADPDLLTFQYGSAGGKSVAGTEYGDDVGEVGDSETAVSEMIFSMNPTLEPARNLDLGANPLRLNLLANMAQNGVALPEPLYNLDTSMLEGLQEDDLAMALEPLSLAVDEFRS